MGSLSCVSTNMSLVYKFLLIYSSLYIVSGQQNGQPIECVVEVFLHAPVQIFT